MPGVIFSQARNRKYEQSNYVKISLFGKIQRNTEHIEDRSSPSDPFRLNLLYAFQGPKT